MVHETTIIFHQIKPLMTCLMMMLRWKNLNDHRHDVDRTFVLIGKCDHLSATADSKTNQWKIVFDYTVYRRWRIIFVTMIQSYNSETVIEIRRVNTNFSSIRLDNCFFCLMMKENEAMKIFSDHLDKWFICYDRTDFEKDFFAKY